MKNVSVYVMKVNGEVYRIEVYMTEKTAMNVMSTEIQDLLFIKQNLKLVVDEEFHKVYKSKRKTYDFSVWDSTLR